MNINFKDALLPYLHAHLPGCPGALIEQHAREALRDFCEKTHAWQHDVPPLGIRDGQTRYTADCIPEGTEIVVVREVLLRDRPLRPLIDFTVRNRNTIVLCREPQTSIPSALKIRVALRPAEATKNIDDCENFEALWADWRKAIEYRTLSTLQLMPRQTWSDENLGAANETRYYHETAKCKRDMNKQQTVGSLTCHAPRRFV